MYTIRSSSLHHIAQHSMREPNASGAVQSAAPAIWQIAASAPLTTLTAMIP